jgi:phage shock protein C
MTETFYRDKSGGMIAGVCAGLADYFGVSPTILRLGFVLLALAGGPGVMIYLVLWLILPEKATLGTRQGDTVQQNARDIGAEARSFGRELQGMLGGKGETAQAPSKRVLWLGGILILVGLISLGRSLGWFGWFREDLAWALALILAGGVMLYRALGKKH